MTETRNPTSAQHTILDSNAERSFWERQFADEPYYEDGLRFADYETAYETGYKGYAEYGSDDFEDAERRLRADWERRKGDSRLDWDRARHAIRAAWHRVERALPGDADRDGR